MGMLTVRENIEFSASLRLPRETTQSQRREKVDNIVTELGLSSCADTRVSSSAGFLYSACIGLKLMMMVHRCLNGRAPQYLAVHCVPLSRQRNFRSAEQNLLHVPRHRLNTYGHRAFTVAGPSAWNSSPDTCLQLECLRSCLQAPAEYSFVLYGTSALRGAYCGMCNCAPN